MSESPPLLRPTAEGLYCEAGDFFVDPWRPVDRAVITHAHADHACSGCRRYLTARDGRNVLRSRLTPDSVIDSVAYGETISINGVEVSFHPAGHILGSAQIRVESRGQVWVVSGDYKVEADATCAPFEPVRCHVFITESTFGLPIYRWPVQARVFESINAWWLSNQNLGRASVIFAYALGKAQRILAGVDPNLGPIFTHGAVEKINRAYRESGVDLPRTTYAGAAKSGANWSRGLIVAPPSAQGTPWIRRFGPASTGFASGWMLIRGARRRRAVDRGFVLSDHVDWPALLGVIDATGAERILLTHGYTNVVARWLREQGRDAQVISTHYEGERIDAAEEMEMEVEASTETEASAAGAVSPETPEAEPGADNLPGIHNA